MTTLSSAESRISSFGNSCADAPFPLGRRHCRVFGALAVATAFAIPFLSREFMPELEEGNVYIRGTFPVSISLAEAAAQTKTARHILQKYPEASAILSQVGRPDDGT